MIEWIVSSSVLIIALVFIRQLFKKRLSMRVRYAFWLVVALRLLVPVFFFESSFSIWNLLERVNVEDTQDGNSWLQEGIQSWGAEGQGQISLENDIQNLQGSIIQEELPNNIPQENGLLQNSSSKDNVLSPDSNIQNNKSSGSYGIQNSVQDGSGLQPLQFVMVTNTQIVPDKGVAKNDRMASWGWLGYIWLAGLYLAGGLVFVINFIYRRKVYRSRSLYQDRGDSQLPVYVSAAVNMPCMFGLLHPAIYLTPDVLVEEKALKYVLCHENTHYRHKDHLWALVRVVCICIHWYNPLVWLAAYLSRQDCELACDEETIEWLGEGNRIDYGRTLLAFSVQGGILLGGLQLSTTMSGRKKQLKERLQMIARQPQKYVGALAVALLLVVVLFAATFSGSKASEMQQDTEGKVEDADGQDGDVGGDGKEVGNAGSQSGGSLSGDAGDNLTKEADGLDSQGGMEDGNMGNQDGKVPENAGGLASGEQRSFTFQKGMTAREAYQVALEQFYWNKIFPNGDDFSYETDDFSDVPVAVYDIDSDGKEELIIQWYKGITAGHRETIFEYDSDSGTFLEEFSGIPMQIYYDNGIIEEPWSHNQGLAGDFWPYFLHQYDKDSDSYREVGIVDAWDRKRGENGGMYGNIPFPEDVDVDGDGFVYYIMKDEIVRDTPVDGDVYQQWRDSYIGDAEVVQLPYQYLKDVVTGTPVLEGQIMNQTFDVWLEGWGNVTFAAFMPEYQTKLDEKGNVCYGDVRYMFLKKDILGNEKVIYTLPAYREDYSLYSEQFQKVKAIDFQDYNEDGRPDILVITEYKGTDYNNVYDDIKLYTQEDDGREFILDSYHSEEAAKAYSYYSEGMTTEAVYQALADHSHNYYGSHSVWEVERYLRKIKKLFLTYHFYSNGYREIAYPITIEGVVYQDFYEFGSAWELWQEMTSEFLPAMESESCYAPYQSWRGISMANGCVWIDDVWNEEFQTWELKITEINRRTQEDFLDTSIQMNWLLYGNLRSFTPGYLTYTIPQREKEDYRLYFFETEDGRYNEFHADDYAWAQAEIAFPDAREGNRAIGKFVDIYFAEVESLSSSQWSDVFVVARYEIDGQLYYDTRIYLGEEMGYTLATDFMQELNERYHRADVEYPVMQVMKEIREAFAK